MWSQILVTLLCILGIIIGAVYIVFRVKEVHAESHEPHAHIKLSVRGNEYHPWEKILIPWTDVRSIARGRQSFCFNMTQNQIESANEAGIVVICSNDLYIIDFEVRSQL